MKLTDLKGCGKQLVTVIKHKQVMWWQQWGKIAATGMYGRFGPKEMKVYDAGPNYRGRVCGEYRKGWGCRVYLCDSCIIKNGLKW